MDFSKLTENIAKIKVKNVVDMPLFYGLFTTLFTILSAYLKLPEYITIVLFIFSGSLYALAIYGYLFFSKSNPDYLRSEEYNLKKHSLEILGDSDNILPIDAQNIVDITNPYKLEDSKKILIPQKTKTDG